MTRLRLITVLTVITLIASGCNLYGFGRNGDGQLGRGNTLSPTGQLTAVTTDRVALAYTVGPGNVCSIDPEDRMYCWGGNTNGRLGVGDTDSRFTATEVQTTSRWIDVALEENHSCAVRTNNTLWCWGLAGEGQTGQGMGNTNTTTFPHQVGGGTNWASVGTGFTHSCAIRTGGTLWCWGANDNHQTGTIPAGAPPVIWTPVQVNADSDWAEVQAGFDFTCARKTDGRLFCWGDNTSGQIGQGTTVNQVTPAQVGTATYSSFGLGYNHVCAVETTGALWCWGQNAQGQLGLGDTVNRDAPTQVGTSTDWTSATAGASASCGLRNPGTAWCWGANSDGGLGVGDTVDRDVPTQIGSATSWITLATGGPTTCGEQFSSQQFRCWGRDDAGQVGDGDPGPPVLTPSTISTGGKWELMAGGRRHSCGLLAGTGELYCWGDNFFGQLGFGDAADRLSPGRVPNPAGVTTWVSIATGAHHTCTVAQAGTLWCWGDNAQGQLGLGDFTNRDEPVQVGTATDWASVVAGSDSSCALRQNGKLHCWGNNASGQLGTGNFIAYFTPQAIAPALNFQAVDIDFNHACAIRSTDALWCWGDNDHGELGLGTTGAANPTPTLVDLTFDGRAVTVATNHSCAINGSGDLFCWGQNVYTATGTSSGDSLVPTLVDDVRNWNPDTLTAGLVHTCALSAASGGTDEPYCWGINSYRQVDPGTEGNIIVDPFLVATGINWKNIATGSFQTLISQNG